jgi:Skp family chaperone for outer membrane proteins
MKNMFICAALAAAALAPTAAAAQAVPAAVVAVVDLQRVTAECTACKTAAATLRSQVTALQTRQRTLTTPLETEGRAIQTAINALNGKEPDAALQARIRAFEQKRQQGAQEITRQQDQIQRNQQHIQQQIATKLAPIYRQVMQRRGANLLVETSTTLATAASVDVTTDVLAALNAAMPTISTTAPAQPQQQQQPQGR